MIVGVVADVSRAVLSALFSFLILKLIDKTIGLRVSSDEEVQGLDVVLHEETGYSGLT